LQQAATAKDASDHRTLTVRLAPLPRRMSWHRSDRGPWRPGTGPDRTPDPDTVPHLSADVPVLAIFLEPSPFRGRPHHRPV